MTGAGIKESSTLLEAYNQIKSAKLNRWVSVHLFKLQYPSSHALAPAQLSHLFLPSPRECPHSYKKELVSQGLQDQPCHSYKKVQVTQEWHSHHRWGACQHSQQPQHNPWHHTQQLLLP